jgi:hypothetical protein
MPAVTTVSPGLGRIAFGVLVVGLGVRLLGLLGIAAGSSAEELVGALTVVGGVVAFAAFVILDTA